ncbi:hypothetical protein B0A48_03235 [Cryoendolithus antarcticus]|uniref:rRNA methyltransferase 2, mitochondrial n=1 Tax=Cryoendolithus antarcticus TaxID=1507870 RepID=A0A1V8TJU0_9PEZI|nr:hypothetical protein B0A48_03235 [Cryoendolithus antarcticus]
MANPHRGLPPPSAMTLPDPTRQTPHAPSGSMLGQPLGPMPQPPNQWQGQEESMRHWLIAKSEEDKRKQEEEKTRQESLRLEQRRVEQSMLRESLQGGVPPQMVPMIYAGIGGANLAQVSMEWLHQYAAQLQAAQQQQIMQASPEASRDPRMIGPASGVFAPLQPAPVQVLASQQPEQVQQPPPLQTSFSTYQPLGRPDVTSVPRSVTHTQLPRLTTNEMYVHQPPANNPSSAHPLQQSQSISDQPTSSPSIYFHHWVPPADSKDSKSMAPHTPATKTSHEPLSAHPGLDSGTEYRESPRKRKAQGGHHQNPPPSSAGPIHPSPSFSSASSTSGRRGGGHQRTRSGTNPTPSESRPQSRKDLEVQRSSATSAGDQAEESKTRPESRQSVERPDSLPRSAPATSLGLLHAQARVSSTSSSSTRWLARQSNDPHTRASALQDLKSRAAFKLLEIDSRYHLFRPGQSVVDLGYAPGSWSQVARSKVGKGGKVVGIDIIPVQPPRGVSALQGDFLSEAVQARVRAFVRGEDADGRLGEAGVEGGEALGMIERVRNVGDSTALDAIDHEEDESLSKGTRKRSAREEDAREGRVVDVVLSDMCAPWPLSTSTWINSVNRPYRRMMNTSGNPFRDHAGSMDLCLAALTFAHDCLVTGGHFLCKYYQGAEEKALETQLKKLFEKVHRVKPASSRKESREAYFVALRRKAGVSKEHVFSDG